MKLFLVLSLFVSASAFAGNRERMVVIESDDSPGDNFIDLVQNSDGSLQSLVYEADTTLTFTTQQLQSQPAVLREASGKDVIILKLDTDFNPAHGGHVIVEFLNNGITGSYKDFRILINLQASGITFSSDPNPSDSASDGNSYKSVFNKLFFYKRTLLGQEIGIDHVTPSIVPTSTLDNGVVSDQFAF